MKKSFTQDDVILFLYGELSQDEGMKLLAEMEVNDELRSFFVESLETIRALPHFSMNPHPTSVKIVLEESQSSALEIF